MTAGTPTPADVAAAVGGHAGQARAYHSERDCAHLAAALADLLRCRPIVTSELHDVATARAQAIRALQARTNRLLTAGADVRREHTDLRDALTTLADAANHHLSRDLTVLLAVSKAAQVIRAHRREAT